MRIIEVQELASCQLYSYDFIRSEIWELGVFEKCQIFPGIPTKTIVVPLQLLRISYVPLSPLPPAQLVVCIAH